MCSLEILQVMMKGWSKDVTERVPAAAVEKAAWDELGRVQQSGCHDKSVKICIARVADHQEGKDISATETSNVDGVVQL